MKLNYNHTVYACYLGYITQAIINNFAPLLFLTFQDSFGIPLEKITLLITLNFVTQLFVDFISAKFVDKIGYRTSIIIAHICCALGLIGMAVLPHLIAPYAGLMISVILYAIGGGIIEVLISPIVEACPSDNKASAMSLLHSFYCWGSVAVVLLSTLFLGGFGKQSWPILALIWALVPVFNTVYFTMVPINSLADETEPMSIKQLFSLKIFWIFAVLMLCAGASELAMTQWASAFTESALGVSKAVGDLAGPCFFAVLMGTCRVLYAKFGAKLDLIKAVTLSCCLCIFAYLIIVFSPSPIMSLIGCGICGFSVGLLWPGVFSLAAEKCPKGATAMFAFLALAGDLGCSTGPTLVGFIAGAFNDNLKAGLLAAIIFPIIMIIFAQILKRTEK
ncbi:MAG: MFS transporter [Oscillospiraceae bacterium]|nr:MFS transporter [Oscillospiraceae bacterium]